MKFQYFLPVVVSLLLTVTNSFAQTLKDNASVRTSDNKDVVLWRAERSIEAFTLPTDQANWYDVYVRVLVDKSMLEDEILAEGTVLYLAGGETYATLEREIKVFKHAQAQGRKNKNRWEVVLKAKAFHTQFEKGSIPERKLEEMLNTTKKGMISREMDALIEEWQLKLVDMDEFIIYPIYQTQRSLSKESSFKMLIVYKRGGAFFGIITNEFQLNIPVKSEKEESDLHFYFPAQKATDRDFDALMNVVFEFIKL